MTSINRVRLAVLAATALPVLSAHAELPEGVATAVSAAQASGVALVVLLAAAGAAVYLIAKLLKRFGIFM